MSLFQCQHCGCVENTALSLQGFKFTRSFDWTGIEGRKGKLLCSACGPSKHTDQAPSKYGKWHGQFPRMYLPMDMFRTDERGDLVHIETGSKNYTPYIIKTEQADDRIERNS